VICDRCGRSNPDNLAFCQDCGRRLVSQAAVVPPTPATGLGVVPVAAEATAEVPAGARMSRPEAPAFSFDSAREGGDGVACPMCSTRNPPGNRFCVACGARFPPINAGAPAAVVQASPALVGTAGPIAATSASRVVCSRCNGASDSTMLYCQFCGASLRQEGQRGTNAVGAQPLTSTTRPDELRPADNFNTGGVPRPARGATQLGTAAVPAGASRLVTIARDGAEGASYP